MKNTLFIPPQKTPHFSHQACQVTWEQNLSLPEELPQEDQDRFQELFALTHKSPKKTLPELIALQKKYPDLPPLLNLLSFAYIQRKKIKKAEKLIEENYRKNPGNLFAKINYADQCLRMKKIDQIPFIFNDLYDLTKVCPNRKVFHVSEFRGFMTLMGLYHLSINQKDPAICYHYLAYKVDPRHSSTRYLGKKLYRTSIWAKLKQLFC